MERVLIVFDTRPSLLNIYTCLNRPPKPRLRMARHGEPIAGLGSCDVKTKGVIAASGIFYPPVNSNHIKSLLAGANRPIGRGGFCTSSPSANPVGNVKGWVLRDSYRTQVPASGFSIERIFVSLIDPAR